MRLDKDGWIDMGFSEEVAQFAVHFFDQIFKSGKVAQVRGVFLEVAPQEFNGIKVGRIAG